MANDHKDVTVQIEESAQAVAQAVAQALLELVREHSEQRAFTIALSGGSTPQQLYQLMAQAPYLEAFPWERMAFFFGDERSVPATHADSNYRMATEALLAHVPSARFRMEADTGNAEGYEKVLHEQLPLNAQGIPQFDVILLGIGTDGHTASLFPGTLALQEQSRWVVMNEVPQLNTARMTLTYPVLEAARHVWVIATGASKQPIVQGALHPTPQQELPDWPILQVHPKPGELTWWLDREAISRSSTF